MKRCIVLFILLIVTAVTACSDTAAIHTFAPPPQKQPKHFEQLERFEHKCIPEFSEADNWLAADGGRSVPLPNGTFIHLFGDTLLDNPPTFVGNSIGLAECNDDEFSIQYLWQENDNNRQAFFEPEIDGIRVWPSDGFYTNDKLYFTLSKIITTDSTFGFDYEGALLAIIDNPLDHPLDWNIEYIGFTKREVYWPIKGTVIQDGFVYILSSMKIREYPNPAILLRMLLSDIPNLQYLSASGKYRDIEEFSVEDAFIILDSAPPSVYVHYHADLEQWVSIHASEVFASDEMMIRTAPELKGPWSQGEVVYRFPEMDPGVPIICYAVTEHPHLRKDDVFVVTYACNTLDGPFPPLTQLDLYRPKTVLIDF